MTNDMTLRDYFAGHALSGLTGHVRILDLDAEDLAAFARYAYALADAMLRERDAVPTDTTGGWTDAERQAARTYNKGE